MAHSITIAAGKSNVALPNGQRYNSGARVLLSDEEYSYLSASFKSAYLASDTTQSGGLTTVVPAPTGVTANDTPAVTSSITAFTSARSFGPATLQFQDGTYQIDSNAAVIRSLTDFAVRGSGATVIAQAPNRAGLANNITGDLFVIADCTDFSVEGITLDGMRDAVAPMTVLTANAASGQPSVTVAAGQGSRYLTGQRLNLFGGLFASGGSQATNTGGADKDKSDQGLIVQSVTAGGGSGGGDLITFTANLANGYTAAAGTLSDGFGPFAAAGAYLTPYQTASGNSVAGRTGLGGEDQQNGLHLLNCQRFALHQVTGRNVWESPIKLGTGFGASPLGDACADGEVIACTGYHGYDQGISVWASQRIKVSGCTLISTGWAGISFSHSDKCTAAANTIKTPYYRPPGDNNSGSGIAVEGGDGNVITGNQVDSPWCNAVVLRVSPLTFGVNTGSPPTLAAQVNAGTAAGTSVQVSASGQFQAGGTYCLMDAERTEKIGIASVIDSTHVTFDRITRFTHASGVQVNAAVATDTIVTGNVFRDSQVASLAEIESSARTILRGNDLIGCGVLPGLSPFAFGVNCSQTGLGASTLGGEGAVIEGNVIGRTSNEAIYLNNTSRIAIRGNTIGPSFGGSPLIHEDGSSDWNRIENNILDAGYASPVRWAGAHTVVRRNAGRYPSLYDLAVSRDSPALWWTFGDASGSGTAADNSGNGHTGTASNVTFGQPGFVADNSAETAAQFVNGSPSIVTSSYQAGAQGSLSVECWINALGITQPSGSARVICNSHTDSDHNGFQIQVNTATGVLYAHVNMGNGTTSTDIGGTIAMPSAGQVHLVATYDGTTIRLYQNGFLIASGALAGPVTAGSATGVAAGGNPVYNGDYWSGLIGQVAVYPGTVLSSARIQAHYMAGAYAG